MMSEVGGVGTGGEAPVLSTITVTYHSAGKLAEFLGALDAARACLPLEVIIVDNGSTDGTVEAIRAQWPWVRLIANGHNAGFAEGCNQGLEAARGEFLMLLNPDCFTSGEALAGMVAWLRAHPSAGAAGCTLLHGDGAPQKSAHAEPSPVSFIASNSLLSPMLEVPGKLLWRLGIRGRSPRRCDWLMGSCIMMPRDTFAEVGGLEPAYFMYSEDADWCRRVRAAGREVWFLPQFVMTHLHKATAARHPEFTFRRLYRSLLLYANRHKTRRENYWFRRTVIADLHARRPLYWLLSLLRPGRRAAYRERIASCRRLIEIYHAGKPDLYDDPPPGRRTSP